MRKVVSISFAVLYTFLTVGVQLHMHFCHDELKQVSFFEEIDRCCESESSNSCELEKKCCEFARVDFSLDDEHQPVVNVSADQLFFEEPIALSNLVVEGNPSDYSISNNQLRGPPERLYLLNCAFTFYG